MNTRIQNLPSGSLSSSDVIPFDGAGGTKKFSATVITGKAEREDVLPLINLWDEKTESGIYGITGSDAGEKRADATRIRPSNFISVKPSTTYFAHGNVRVLFYGSKKDFLSSGNAFIENTTFTTPSDCYYITFNIVSTYGTTYNNDISINYPATYTGYIPSGLSRTNYHVGALGTAIGMKGWNQLVKGNFSSASDWALTRSGDTYSVEGGVATFTRAGTGSSCTLKSTVVTGFNSSHKYYMRAEVKQDTEYETSIFFGFHSTSGATGDNHHVGSNNKKFTLIDQIATPDADNRVFAFRIGTSATTATNIVYKIRNVMLIDLTELFGAGNEPASCDDVRDMFPASYYPFCSGCFADLLWTNASPSSAFAAQSVDIDLSDYMFVLVDYYIESGSHMTQLVAVGHGGRLDTWYNKNLCVRKCTVSTSGVTFTDGSKCGTVSGTLATDNAMIIPAYIYGVR